MSLLFLLHYSYQSQTTPETPSTSTRRAFAFASDSSSVLQMLQLIRTKKGDLIGDQSLADYWSNLRTWLSNNTIRKKMAREENKRRRSATRDREQGDGDNVTPRRPPR